MVTLPLLFLALGLCVGLLCGIMWGARKGAEKENLRVIRIFGATTRVVYGGAVKAVWWCIEGHITEDEMLDRLRESQDRKDRAKKRLASYEAEYGRAPIDLKGESDGEET